MTVWRQVAAYVSLRSLTPRQWIVLLLLVVLLIGSDLFDIVPYVTRDTLAFEVELLLGLTALGMSLADRLTLAERRRWRNRVVLVTVAVGLAAASAEATTRWVFRSVTSSADGAAYFSRRWGQRSPVLLNAFGFRERGFAAVKAPGTYRIAVVGDSFTFGNGLEPHERYSGLLQQWLPAGFEVLNLAVPGNNTPQHLATLQSRVLPLGPDYVLLQWFVNDIEGDDLQGRPVTRPLLPAPRLHEWLRRRSALYTIANTGWSNLQVANGMTASYADYLQARAGNPHGADARREAALLRAIIDACHRAGASVGMVLFPDTGAPLDASYPFAYLHDRVLEICEAEGITCLDLRNDFAAIGDRRTLWVSPFDHHPSAAANRIAAIKLLETFRREWSAGPQ